MFKICHTISKKIGGERTSLCDTDTHRHSYSANNSCDRGFALDFINRKTSTQVSVSLAQRAGGDGDDDEADEDPTDHTGR